MPNLPLPVGGAPICGGDLPVTDSNDVAAQEAQHVRAPTVAPIRDAIRSAQTKMMLKYQRAAETAAAQANKLRATDVFLQGLGADGKVFKQASESEEAYRTRVLTTPDLVTPSAIIAAANTILAPYTSISCQYFESILDRGFIENGSATWQSFIGQSGNNTGRLYKDDTLQSPPSSTYVPNRNPGAFWVFKDNVGRFFVLRVPDIAPLLDDANNFVYNGSIQDGFWVQDGTSGSVASFIGPPGTALDVYQAVANAVDRIIGQSIRWMLYADPTLT